MTGLPSTAQYARAPSGSDFGGAASSALRLRGTLLVALLLVAGCGSGASASRGVVGPVPFAAVVPRAFEMSLVWRMGRTLALAPVAPRLRVDAAGRPVLLLGGLFVPLRPNRNLAAPPPFRLGHSAGLSDAAWTADGTLLVVSDRALGVATPEGFVRIADLPAAGMRVAAAEPGRCWLFGGEGDFGRRLYLYDRSGTVAPVATAPEPIVAVAGTADRVYVATRSALLRVTPGDGTVLLHQGAEPIRAMAAAGDLVFFSTARGVFFLRDGGVSFRMLDEGAEDLQVRGDDLFLLFPGAGVVRGSPVSSFATLARGGS